MPLIAAGDPASSFGNLSPICRALSVCCGVPVGAGSDSGVLCGFMNNTHTLCWFLLVTPEGSKAAPCCG